VEVGRHRDFKIHVTARVVVGIVSPLNSVPQYLTSGTSLRSGGESCACASGLGSSDVEIAELQLS
jgi:hypothetical protein